MKIVLDDIIPNEEYEKQRKRRRQHILEIKKHRRIDIGPVVSMYFENKETMIYQIQEMALTENIRKEEISDEILAYNPLVPDGQELVATMMIEIDDPIRRKYFLAQLGGIEKNVKLLIGEKEIIATAEDDIDRTTASGKASSVHFLHFCLAEGLVKDFKDHKILKKIEIGHKNYGHITVLNNNNIKILSRDLSN